MQFLRLFISIKYIYKIIIYNYVIIIYKIIFIKISKNNRSLSIITALRLLSLFIAKTTIVQSTLSVFVYALVTSIRAT